jgi:hypothetical protein
MEKYLSRLGIGAMLDVAAAEGQRHGRRLLCRAVGGPRNWDGGTEQNFAISVANLIVVALVDDERRQAIGKLADSEARARMIVDTAHDAYVESIRGTHR